MLPLVDLPPEIPAPTPVIQWVASEKSWSAPDLLPVILAQSEAPVGSKPQPDFIMNTCTETESTGDPSSAMRTVDPAGMLRVYLQAKEGRRIEAFAVKNVAILQEPTHGKITSVIDNTGRPWYAYDAIPDYIGNDRAVFLAEFEGKRYKIVVDLKVKLIVNENNPVCPEPTLIKVTKPSSGASGLDLNGVKVTFADLAGSAIGETTNETVPLIP